MGEHEFKYYVDFNNLVIDDDIAALCVSRPANPNGNVVTDEEVEHLAQLADKHQIPLFIDNAYGLPFPGVVTTNVTWAKHPSMVQSFSLSKIGLPSSRVGIFIGPAEPMRTFAKANARGQLGKPRIWTVCCRVVASG